MGAQESQEDCCITQENQTNENYNNEIAFQQIQEINSHLNKNPPPTITTSATINSLQSTPSTVKQFQSNQNSPPSRKTVETNNNNNLVDFRQFQNLQSRLPMPVFENERLQRLAEVVHISPKVVLTVVSSSTLPQGLTLNINAQGLVNGLRNMKDGVTFFGSKKRLERIAANVKQIEIVNDFVIPSVDQEMNKKNRGRHFQIEYHIVSNQYRIKDLNTGFGCFKRIDSPVQIKNRQLYNIGGIYMIAYLVENNFQMVSASKQQPKQQQQMPQPQPQPQFNQPQPQFIQPQPQPYTDYRSGGGDNYNDNNQTVQSIQYQQQQNAGESWNGNNNANRITSQQHIIQQQQQNYSITHYLKRNNKNIALKLQFFGGPCQGEEYVTIPETNKVLTLGRSKECSLRFNDVLLSKVQCSIEYDEQNGWVFRDGSTEKPSTNGSWLHLAEEQTLYSGFVFKTNQTIIEAQLVQ